jgi:hypothetical protein
MTCCQLNLLTSRSFHNASLDSPRIQKLVAFLKERGSMGATSIEISDHCCTPRSASDVSEARACGLDIVASYEGKSDTGRKIYRYRLCSHNKTK